MIYTVTLGFVPARILKICLEGYYATRNPGMPFRHIFVDQHYPINRAQNLAELKKLALEYRMEWVDPGRNLGLHKGFNYAMHVAGMKKGDIVIGFDPDCLPIDPGWDMALVSAIQQSNDVAWSSLLNARSKEDITKKGYDVRRIAQLECWQTRHAVVNSICAWDVGWLNQVGGLQEPLEWYGLLECAMWPHLQSTGKKWVFLPQWREAEQPRWEHDRAYIVWKWFFAHLRCTTLDFESWLRSENYDLLTGTRPGGHPEAPRVNP